MKMNRRMTDLLNAGATGFVPARFADFVDGGFKESDGCYLFSSRPPSPPLAALKQYPDRTGYECAANEVQVGDFLDNDSGLDQAVLSALGMSSAAFVARRLGAFSRRPFLVIVSVRDGGCTLRFHARRVAEQWLATDLETYQDEAVGVIDSSAP
jgi:hypothetical protein